MKRGIALVIGINYYEDPDINNLDKAVNDAKAITEKLKNLNFDVLSGYDISSSDFDKVQEQFLLKLPNYPLGIFYFAGHGCEIDRENFLVLKNAKVQNHANYTLKRDSVCLQDLIGKMCEKCDTNILIIDACRNTFKENSRRQRNVDEPGFHSQRNFDSIFDIPWGDCRRRAKTYT